MATKPEAEKQAKKGALSMYKIFWSYKNFENSLSLEDKDTANEIWLVLKTVPGVSKLRAEKPQTKQPIKPYVKVEFVSGGKLYTYLAKESIKPGTRVVVSTDDGAQVAKVVETGAATEETLASICPLNRLKYISGIVKEVV